MLAPRILACLTLTLTLAACGAADQDSPLPYASSGRQEKSANASQDSEPAAENDEPTAADAIPLPATFTNPVKDGCADPGILKTDAGGFLVACTGAKAGGAFPLFRSNDLVTWQSAGAGTIFPAGALPGWAHRQWWAPELHKIGNVYVAYYSAQPKPEFQLGTKDYFCIGVAVSEMPEGPYRDIGKPLLCNKDVSLIDATVFYDPASKRNILYYKTNWAPQNKDATIDAIQLSPDGLAIDGTPRRILEVTLPFETSHSIEGPWMLLHEGTYYLFYSAGLYNRDYTLGVARSQLPTRGFEKKTFPILTGSSRWLAPGHNSTVHHRGSDWLVYHAYRDRFDNGRSLLVDKITWENNWPVINTGTPSTAEMPF